MVDYSKWDSFNDEDDEIEDSQSSIRHGPHEDEDGEEFDQRLAMAVAAAAAVAEEEDGEEEEEEEEEEEDDEDEGEDEDEDEGECDEDEGLPRDIYRAAMERNWAVVKAWLEYGGGLPDTHSGGPSLPAAESTPQSMEDLVLHNWCSDVCCPGCIGIPTRGSSLLHLASLSTDFCKASQGTRHRPGGGVSKPLTEKFAHADAEMVCP